MKNAMTENLEVSQMGLLQFFQARPLSVFHFVRISLLLNLMADNTHALTNFNKDLCCCLSSFLVLSV